MTLGVQLFFVYGLYPYSASVSPGLCSVSMSMIHDVFVQPYEQWELVHSLPWRENEGNPMFSMVIDSRSDVYGNAVGRAALPYCPTPQQGKTDLIRAVPLSDRTLK